MELYKCLTKDLVAPLTGFVYPPVGIWTDKIEEPLIRCQVGYHVCEKWDIAGWVDVDGSYVYEVSVKEPLEYWGDKIGTSCVRLDRLVYVITDAQLPALIKYFYKTYSKHPRFKEFFKMNTKRLEELIHEDVDIYLVDILYIIRSYKKTGDSSCVLKDLLAFFESRGDIDYLEECCRVL